MCLHGTYNWLGGTIIKQTILNVMREVNGTIKTQVRHPT